MDKKGILFIVLGLLVAGGLIAFLSGLFSSGGLSVANQPAEEKILDWDGKTVTIEAPLFGEDIVNDRVTYFCGNDGDIEISNVVSVGDDLTLLSTLSSTKRACEWNYIEGEILFDEAGTVEATCDLSAGNAAKWSGSHANCEFGSESLSVSPGEGSEAGASRTFTREVSAGDTITLKLIASGIDNANVNGGGSAQMTLSFKKDKIVSEEVVSTSDSTQETTSEEQSEDSSSGEEVVGEGDPLPDGLWSRFTGWLKSIFSDWEWF